MLVVLDFSDVFNGDDEETAEDEEAEAVGGEEDAPAPEPTLGCGPESRPGRIPRCCPDVAPSPLLPPRLAPRDFDPDPAFDPPSRAFALRALRAAPADSDFGVDLPGRAPVTSPSPSPDVSGSDSWSRSRSCSCSCSCSSRCASSDFFFPDRRVSDFSFIVFVFVFFFLVISILATTELPIPCASNAATRRRPIASWKVLAQRRSVKYSPTRSATILTCSFRLWRRSTVANSRRTCGMAWTAARSWGSLLRNEMTCSVAGTDRFFCDATRARLDASVNSRFSGSRSAGSDTVGRGGERRGAEWRGGERKGRRGTVGEVGIMVCGMVCGVVCVWYMYVVWVVTLRE